MNTPLLRAAGSVRHALAHKSLTRDNTVVGIYNYEGHYVPATPFTYAMTRLIA